MEDARRGLQPRILQIGIEFGQRGRHDHAFVADRYRRQAGKVSLGVGEPILSSAPRQEQTPVERSPGQFIGCVDEDLLDPRQRFQGVLATG